MPSHFGRLGGILDGRRPCWGLGVQVLELLGNLLVTQEMDKLVVSLVVPLRVTPGKQVVDLQFFFIAEGFTANRAHVVLGAGKPSLSSDQGGSARFSPLLPVLPERGVIRGGGAFDQGMLPPVEPVEL